MKDYRLGAVLRKWTTPVHWLLGLFLGLVIIKCWPLALLLLYVFERDERWNDAEEKAHDPTYLPTGCADWWECFAVMMGTFGLEVALDLAGVIAINWWPIPIVT